MKIAALSCVNRNSFASSAFVESIVLNDDTTENRNSLKSIKKYSRKLKKTGYWKEIKSVILFCMKEHVS